MRVSLLMGRRKGALPVWGEYLMFILMGVARIPWGSCLVKMRMRVEDAVRLSCRNTRGGCQKHGFPHSSEIRQS